MITVTRTDVGRTYSLGENTVEAARQATIASAAAASATAAFAEIDALTDAFPFEQMRATKALATADLASFAADSFVLVLADESQSGHRTIYQKSGGVLVLRANLSSLASYFGTLTSNSTGTNSIPNEYIHADAPASYLRTLNKVVAQSSAGDNYVMSDEWVYGTGSLQFGRSVELNFSNSTADLAGFEYHIQYVDENGDGHRMFTIFAPHNGEEDVAAIGMVIGQFTINDWSGIQRVLFDLRGGSTGLVSLIDMVLQFNDNDQAVLKQSNAAGNNTLNLPFIDANDALAVQQPIALSVSKNGALLHTVDNTYNGAAGRNIWEIGAVNADALHSFVNNGGGTYYSVGIDVSDGNSFVISKALRQLGTGNVARCDGTTDRWKGLVKTADNFADDTAAAAGGVAVGELYHNAGAVRVRLT